MKCNKCGAENVEGSKYCKDCGHSLIQTRNKKHKKRNLTYAIILVLTLLGVGIGSAQLMSDNAEPPKQEETKPEMPEVTEEPEEPEEPEKIEEPEETVPAEEPTVGTVTKVENVVPPSEQEEKIEPKKKKNSNY